MPQFAVEFHPLAADEAEAAERWMSKRDLAKGKAVYQNGIADIRRLRMPWLTLKLDDGVLYCFKVGWKFALFFDLDPGRELDVDAMERSLGH